MVKRKTKQLLEARESELKMNLENNYKDLARSALAAYKQEVETCHLNGELKEKDYIKYQQKVAAYENSMVGYHH